VPGDPQRHELNIKGAFLRLFSCGGFQAVNVVSVPPPRSDDRLAIRPEFPILWARAGDVGLLAAGARSFPDVFNPNSERDCPPGRRRKMNLRMVSDGFTSREGDELADVLHWLLERHTLVLCTTDAGSRGRG
jgi:hypothetical protein